MSMHLAESPASPPSQTAANSLARNLVFVLAFRSRKARVSAAELRLGLPAPPADTCPLRLKNSSLTAFMVFPSQHTLCYLTACERVHAARRDSPLERP